MTNPNNAVGTNGAFGGRTSVNAFNDVMGAFQGRGILSGWGIVPSSGMTVDVGGSGTVRDTAIAEDNAGNKTSINNISGSAIGITLNTAPASNSRYDAIVAYVDKPPMGSATQDNPECCGIIPVTGTAASTPSYPDDGAIRSAITADGASGSTAYYIVLGYVLVASGTTTITSGMITAGPSATLNSTQIADGSITSDKVVLSTFTRKVFQRNLIGTYIDNNNKKHDLYRIYYAFTDTIAAGGFVNHNIGLSDCNILSVNFNLYRTDAAGVINIANEPGLFSVVFTLNGDYIRVINNSANAQNSALITGVIECYKKTEQS